MSDFTPDPANVVEMNRFLMGELAELRGLLEGALALLPVRAFWTVADIATWTGMSETQLRDTAQPWRLPNYGRPDLGEGVRRWKAETVRAWYAIPERERRKAWEGMPAAARREYVA